MFEPKKVMITPITSVDLVRRGGGLVCFILVIARSAYSHPGALESKCSCDVRKKGDLCEGYKRLGMGQIRLGKNPKSCPGHKCSHEAQKN